MEGPRGERRIQQPNGLTSRLPPRAQLTAPGASQPRATCWPSVGNFVATNGESGGATDTGPRTSHMRNQQFLYNLQNLHHSARILLYATANRRPTGRTCREPGGCCLRGWVVYSAPRRESGARLRPSCRRGGKPLGREREHGTKLDESGHPSRGSSAIRPSTLRCRGYRKAAYDDVCASPSRPCLGAHRGSFRGCRTRLTAVRARLIRCTRVPDLDRSSDIRRPCRAWVTLHCRNRPR